MTKFVIDNGKNLFESYDKQEIDAIAAQKANTDDVYNKSVIDAIESGLQESIGAIQQNLADNYYQSSFIDTFFATKNGDYDELTAGFAKQLISKVRVTDSAPYNFRTSGGSLDIGNREFDKLIGGTVAWNQLQTSKTGSTRTAQYAPMFGDNWDYTVTIGHVYLASFLQPAGCSVYRQNCKNFSCGYRIYDAPTTPTTISFITKSTENEVSAGVGERLISKNETTETAYSLDNLQFFDLTQMFGATIADYIYSLESANAGAGVAFFRSLFPLPYYEYNAGELMSVKTSMHKMVGFNAWDEETQLGGINSTTGQVYPSNNSLISKNYCRCLPNTAYYLKSAGLYMAVHQYDAAYNYLGFVSGNDSIVTTKENAAFFKLGFTDTYGTEYKNDICINLSWDGERNGEYEEYKAEYYPLAANLELRGIPKLDASNNLYYDGDEYEHTGDVKRKYGVVDLGSANWTYIQENVESPYFQTYIDDILYDSTQNNYLCPKFSKASVGSMGNAEGYFVTNGKYLRIRCLSYSSVDAFKSAMSGIGFQYPLATPTTETAAEFANPQFVDDFGTEQYIDERPVAVPVGHVTEYEQNLRAKLEMSPDSPANDGAYLMQHNNGENSYIPYVSPIPALPTTNGVYSLKCTVTGGVPVLAWVEDTATRNAPDAEPETENENEK